MKQICFSILFLVGTTCALSQQPDSLRPFTAKDYLIKSNAQRTGAWVLTVAGSAGFFATLLANAVTGVTTSLFSAGSVLPEHHSYLLPYLLSSAAIAGGYSVICWCLKEQEKINQLFPLPKNGKNACSAAIRYCLTSFPFYCHADQIMK